MCGNRNGSVTLFNEGNAVKTNYLFSSITLVDYSNGQVVAAAEKGQLIILSEDLEIIKEFTGPIGIPTMISGNTTYLTLSDSSGSVQYYKRNSNAQPKVTTHILSD